MENRLHDQHAREVSIWLRGIKLNRLSDRINAAIQEDKKRQKAAERSAIWCVAFLLGWGLFQVVRFLIAN